MKTLKVRYFVLHEPEEPYQSATIPRGKMEIQSFGDNESTLVINVSPMHDLHILKGQETIASFANGHWHSVWKEGDE